MQLSSAQIYQTEYNFSSFIHIQTRRSSLILGVSEELLQLHYGASLESPENIFFDGIVTAGQEFTPAYSAFGAADHTAALRVTHADQSLATELVYQSHEETEEKRNQVLTTILLKDKILPFYVKLHYLAFYEEDVIQTWVTYEHQEVADVTLHEYPSIELSFSNRHQDYYLQTYQGLWEREHSLQDEKLTLGKKVLENRYGTWSSFGFNPSFMLSLDQESTETHGEVIAGALAWSGAWKISFDSSFGKLYHDCAERRQLSICAGINDLAADYKLSPNEVFETPKFIMTYSASGKGQASRHLHSWARQNALRDGDQERPILLNSWEGAYFSYDENKLLSMMDGLVKMGGEMFVLDDGWFGNGQHARNNAKAGLGDWQVNKEKLPRGLSFLAEEAQKRDLSFGIWVEPEMINPQSKTFEEHPDWAIQQKDRQNILYRNQLILDLSNPEVQEFVYNSVANILKESPKISYVKWDCNRSFTNLGSTYLSADKQTHLWKDYVDALYAIYQKLGENFPSVIFQACASGGGRIDYGILAYHHEFWTSDNTDALQRIFIQWGTNHIYPAIATAAHVSICPNHQTGRTLPLKFRFDVAMSGRLGLELSPDDMNDEEISFVNRAVKEYKVLRPIVQFGDLYRLSSPYESDYAILMYVSEDKERALFFAYKVSHHLGQLMPQIKFEGLCPTESYSLREVNRIRPSPWEGKIIDAQSLMNHGIKLNLTKEYDSCIIELAVE